ncbi:hypothetical protein N9971_00450 [bacterium]|nr:hypothetical protein [bacterium]
MSAANEWCRVCHTQHAVDLCPGYVQLTGPERPSRRFVARRDGRTERYQTIVGEAGERWQARIVTVPNRIWAAPCGGGTAKFLAESQEEAERKAVLFIYTRCASLKLEVKELSSATDAAPALPCAEGKHRERALPVLFGTDRPMWPAQAVNLDYEGMFLATGRVESLGTRVVVKMLLEHFHIPLTAVVVRVNSTATDTEPVGLGIALEAPPFAYSEYVDTLQSARDDNAVPSEV